MKVERHYLLSGATDVEIIEDCHCAKKSRNCERKSRVVVLFAGSFYETKKDVGICQGHCSKGPPSKFMIILDFHYITASYCSYQVQASAIQYLVLAKSKQM